MKQNYIETKAKSQNWEYIYNEPTGNFNHLHEVGQESNYRNDYLAGGLTVTSSVARRQRHVGGNCFSNAPPGRAREPGAARGHPPDCLAEPPGQTTIQFKNQLFNKNQNSIYYKHLIFN